MGMHRLLGGHVSPTQWACIACSMGTCRQIGHFKGFKVSMSHHLGVNESNILVYKLVYNENVNKDTVAL